MSFFKSWGINKKKLFYLIFNDFRFRFSRTKKEEIVKRELFYQQFIKTNDLCFDVGANFGNRIEPLVNIGAKIIAVEPQKICCDFLKYKFGNKVRIIPKGFCEEECTRSLNLADETTISSFSKEWINSVKKTVLITMFGMNILKLNDNA